MSELGSEFKCWWSRWKSPVFSPEVTQSEMSFNSTKCVEFLQWTIRKALRFSPQMSLFGGFICLFVCLYSGSIFRPELTVPLKVKITLMSLSHFNISVHTFIAVYTLSSSLYICLSAFFLLCVCSDSQHLEELEIKDWHFILQKKMNNKWLSLEYEIFVINCK